MDGTEWAWLRGELDRAGVAGSEDLGRFVNSTKHFEPSRFDERAAMPTLVRVLPELTDRTLVPAVAGHLRRPWARPAAFDALAAAFEHWAPQDERVGWSLGDAVGTTATKTQSARVVQLSENPEFGRARQMLVYALRRFRSQEGVNSALERLAFDPDLVLHALGSLRTTAGLDEALRVGRAVVAEDLDSERGKVAARVVRKFEKALAKNPA